MVFRSVVLNTNLYNNQKLFPTTPWIVRATEDTFEPLLKFDAAKGGLPALFDLIQTQWPFFANIGSTQGSVIQGDLLSIGYQLQIPPDWTKEDERDMNEMQIALSLRKRIHTDMVMRLLHHDREADPRMRPGACSKRMPAMPEGKNVETEREARLERLRGQRPGVTDNLIFDLRDEAADSDAAGSPFLGIETATREADNAGLSNDLPKDEDASEEARSYSKLKREMRILRSQKFRQATLYLAAAYSVLFFDAPTIRVVDTEHAELLHKEGQRLITMAEECVRDAFVPYERRLRQLLETPFIFPAILGLLETGTPNVLRERVHTIPATDSLSNVVRATGKLMCTEPFWLRLVESLPAVDPLGGGGTTGRADSQVLGASGMMKERKTTVKAVAERIGTSSSAQLVQKSPAGTRKRTSNTSISSAGAAVTKSAASHHCGRAAKHAISSTPALHGACREFAPVADQVSARRAFRRRRQATAGHNLPGLSTMADLTAPEFWDSLRPHEETSEEGISIVGGRTTSSAAIDGVVTTTAPTSKTPQLHGSISSTSAPLHIVEVGTHTGDCTLYAWQKFGKQVQVTGFEPNRLAQQTFKRSIFGHGAEQSMKVEHMLVGNDEQPGQKKSLYFPTTRTAETFLDTENSCASGRTDCEHDVVSVTLDYYFRRGTYSADGGTSGTTGQEQDVDNKNAPVKILNQNHLPKIDILKLHCQFCELNALKGAKVLLQKNEICVVLARPAMMSTERIFSSADKFWRKRREELLEKEQAADTAPAEPDIILNGERIPKPAAKKLIDPVPLNAVEKLSEAQLAQQKIEEEKERIMDRQIDREFDDATRPQVRKLLHEVLHKHLLENNYELYLVDDPLFLKDPMRLTEFNIQEQKIANVTKLEQRNAEQFLVNRMVDKIKLRRFPPNLNDFEERLDPSEGLLVAISRKLPRCRRWHESLQRVFTRQVRDAQLGLRKSTDAWAV
ncbi:unnamed protein product [Amoebophrya sp. A120]|nr:unnamed protein product [Amoebophrya sp. A120]|eukprot:GSA120T00017756001.1